MTEVDHGLECEQPHEPEGDSVQHRGIPGQEGGVQELADDEGEGEPDSRGQKQKRPRSGQCPFVW